MERPDKTTPRVRGTSERVNAAARALRRTETPTEQLLWAALRGRRLNGLKFRRQHPVGPFVLDFYCPERKLVVELDGAVHDGPLEQEQDAYRTFYLAAYGYRVLRFRNDEVLLNLPVVLERIATAALALEPVQAEQEAFAQGTPPLPELGEGVGG
jgi:very-short-patch-repair endonuclease